MQLTSNEIWSKIIKYVDETGSAEMDSTDIIGDLPSESDKIILKQLASHNLIKLSNEDVNGNYSIQLLKR